METVYLGIILFLFMLAVFDLVVGVSNDAVNFLSSAVGAKVAPYRVIMWIAATGILCGALMSNGMMEIARHGIFRPEQFFFQELLCIFLAVMVTDVIILDVFNTLGLPTSTTVSMVFELLGGTFALTLVKMAGTEGMHFADYLNTEKALSVIMGIFLSVAVAFFFGMVVQWLARLLFTFRYREHLKWSIGLFGGIATTAIVYFMLIKGVKQTAFMTPEAKEWIAANSGTLLLACLAGFTVVMQVLHWLHVNVFRIVVLLGTFALAMAFAGNDLVNFIGVPLAGYDSYLDYAANGAGSDSYLMGALNTPARTPFLFLAAAGLIMVWTLCTSKKAQKVIKTSVDLSRQDEGEEMFGSSAVARSIVRTSMSLANTVASITPPRLKAWLDTRFSQEDAVIADGAAFDLVRASVNLLLASLLIALGTSLKLPLSTTYVTFMVAMGTSLADRAWGRESAVFRITGVLSVIGGWFITAGVAFTVCFFVALAMYYGGAVVMAAMIVLAVALLIHSNIRYRRKLKSEHEDNLFRQILAEKDKNRVWELLRTHVSGTFAGMLAYTADNYAGVTDGFIEEERRTLRRVAQTIDRKKELLRKVRRRELIGLRRTNRNTAIEKNMWFHLGSNCCVQLHYALKRMCDLCREHVDNNFNPLPASCAAEFIPVRDRVKRLLLRAEAMIRTNDYSHVEELMSESAAVNEQLTELQQLQLNRIQEEQGSINVSLVYLNVLQESQEIISALRHMLRASRNFQQ
ncbi:inorganic phosphate transporter [uncultured Alistipes sp.]|jgi:hypothetical protein|uniref:inorganic phosphate transporter n=1 Tax=uncultured Alistipes sp. TaxID=538949 RepID=UPI0025E9FF91|nr:inorganic phosphate transporter [uncultured Alistipes sp.]